MINDFTMLMMKLFFILFRNWEEVEVGAVNGASEQSLQGRSSPDSCYASSEANDSPSQGRFTPESVDTVSVTTDSAQGSSSQR